MNIHRSARATRVSIMLSIVIAVETPAVYAVYNTALVTAFRDLHAQIFSGQETKIICDDFFLVMTGFGS
jgi:hypothetical protein